jgi:ion channel POLLUX/CASTOR
VEKGPLLDRVRYEFDNVMAKGTIALIAALAVLSLVVLLLFSLVVSIAGIAPVAEGGTEPSFVRVMWMGLMRTLDAGTMGGDEGSWAFLFSALGVTMGGVFIISTFIGVLTSGIESKMEELRKGRSKVIESDHTVILGWSSQVYAIISELVIANASRPRACIVVLGEAEKPEMEEAIRERIPNPGKTRIVCRNGSPMDLNDLEMVSIHTARAIVVLSPDEDVDRDSSVIKTMLAITNSPKRKKEKYHIVAEIRDPKNMEAARLVGRDEAELVLVGDLISRITVQTCRQSGLSVVYTELLDFDGCEIYFKEEPRLNGLTFLDSLYAFEDSAVMGMRKADGRIMLNPPMGTPIEAGDRVIAIAEDDDALKLSGRADFGVDKDAIRNIGGEPPKPERALILGWNWRITTILNELDKYVAPGSEVVVVSDKTEGKEEINKGCRAIKNQRIFYRHGDTTDRRTLEELKVERFDHMIILCSDTLPEQQSDARTLISLLHLRDISDKIGKDFSIVSEMLDIRNRELAEVTRADDFIVSDKLVSLMLSQISENKELNAVFSDLFREEGSEIYLKPIKNYVLTGRPVNFYTVVEAARRRNEVAIGYRIVASGKDAAKGYGVKVNPVKSEMVTFSEHDKVIVLAEN